MSDEVLRWVFGIAILQLIGHCVSTTWLLISMRKDVTVLLAMHREPDKYGFGTGTTNKIIKDNTRAMNALVHYTKWLAEQMTGKEAPSPMSHAR